MPALDQLNRVAEISLTVARRAGSLALSTVRQVADMALERRSKSRSESWEPPPPVSTRPSSTQPRAAPTAAPARRRTPEPEPAPAPGPTASAGAAEEPADREAVLVAESADAGAADGAGAQIHVGEPWKGYGSLTAKEVNDRLAAASPEALAVARLYESTNRNRVTVLREIDRRLQAAES